ncbi:MAG: plastocyanin/azurin family copper-binding protein [Gemmatimonadales bacterium]
MRMRAVMGCTALIAIAACGGGGSNGYSSPTNSTPTSPTGTTQVPANTIQATDGLVFNPNTLTVAKGTTVTFTFGSTTHNVTFSGTGAQYNIPDTYNGSAQRTFSTAGTFGFTCSIHGGYMTGQITVQ